MNSPIQRRFSAVVVGLALVVAACGSDSKSSSSEAPASSAASSTPSSADSADLCAAREALTTSFQSLTSTDLVKNGTAGITTAVTTIKDNLADVKAAASEDLKPQISAFEDALDALGTAVTNIGSSGVSGVITAAGTVATTGSTLVTSLNAVECN